MTQSQGDQAGQAGPVGTAPGGPARGSGPGQQAPYPGPPAGEVISEEFVRANEAELAAVTGALWPAMLAAAICMLAAGLLLLIWPEATLTVVAILIGAALIVAGLLRLWEGFTSRDESGGMRAASVVIGLLAGLAGLYCLKHHDLTVLVVATVVGLFWIMHGVIDIAGAVTSGPAPGRGLKAIIGVCSLAAGLIVLFWPGISLVLLLTVLGAWLLFYGVALAVLALRVRRDARSASGRVRPG